MFTQELEETLESKLEQDESMASLEHGALGMLLGSYLVQYVYANKLGAVFDAQTSFKFQGKISNRQPDIAFVRTGRLPASWRKQADFAPDLAVEVASENDKIFEADTKVRQYQKSGVQLVWIVYPDIRCIDVYRLNSGLRIQRFIDDDEITGEDVIPGFKLKISKLFEQIPATDSDEI